MQSSVLLIGWMKVAYHDFVVNQKQSQETQQLSMNMREIICFTSQSHTVGEPSC